MKRILVLADLHCGHFCGLTPTPYQVRPAGTGLARKKREKYAAIEKEAWSWYIKAIKRCGPFDIVVCNGDAIDGKGTRSGGTELLAVAQDEQCRMASACLKQATKNLKARNFSPFGSFPPSFETVLIVASTLAPITSPL